MSIKMNNAEIQQGEKILDSLRKEMVKEVASFVDEQFFQFLREQGITNSRKIDEINKALEENGLEFQSEIKNHENMTFYTFKLCRVVATHKFKINAVSNINQN